MKKIKFSLGISEIAKYGHKASKFCFFFALSSFFILKNEIGLAYDKYLEMDRKEIKF